MSKEVYLEFAGSQEPEKGAALAAMISDVQYKKEMYKGAISQPIEDQATGQVAEYLDRLVADADMVKATIDEHDRCKAMVFVGDDIYVFKLGRGPKRDTIDVEVAYQIVEKACTSDDIKSLAYAYDSIVFTIPFRGFVGDLYRVMLVSYKHPLRISDYRS